MRYENYSHSPIDRNAFTTEGMRAVHSLFLAGGVAIPLLCIACAIACWRRRPLRRWLWIPFILVGWPVLSLNWLSGVLTIVPMGVNLLGAGFSQAGPLHPFHVQLGVPIGSLAFLIARPRSRDDPGPLPDLSPPEA